VAPYGLDADGGRVSDDDAVWLDEHRRIVREIEVERDAERAVSTKLRVALVKAYRLLLTALHTLEDELKEME
jgi:hypothetical protein